MSNSARLVKRLLFCLGLLVLLSACSSPAAHLQAEAERLGFKRLELNAEGFALSAFYQPGLAKGKRLHVYLEGDGRPWEQGVVPAADPTTRQALMLSLMAIDTAPALYLGRPCYNGHADDVGCDSRLWTHARYGQQVIAAMSAALQNFSQQQGYDELLLLGHSGGGSLALLLAECLPQTQAVVTLAVNYDIDLWADHHGYQRLTSSENPAKHLNNGIPEWHFLAEQDRTVPPALILKALQHRPHSVVEIIPGIDHQHGWQRIWPQILTRLAQRQ